MRILHLEDNPADAELVRELLRLEIPDVRIVHVATREAFLAELRRDECDVILSDYSLPGFSGLDALALARHRAAHVPFVFLSGSIGEDRAIEALRAGAADYVLKDRTQRLGTALTRSARDAADRRARRDAEARIRVQAEIIELAPLAVVITDLNDRVTSWNRGATRLFGWTAAEALGRPVAELFPPDTHPQLAAGREATVRATEWRGEFHLRTKEGTPVVATVFMTLIRGEDGQPRARLSIGTDVTEMRQLEEQFLRAQRMENLGLLAAGIAHDFNNILAPILMASNLFRLQGDGPPNPRLLDMLEKSAERGAALVRQILAFAHGTGGEQHLLQCKHLVREMATLIEETFPRALRFEQDIATDLWPIRGNPTQLHQVLLNLCVNARDAMPDGGTLRLRAVNHPAAAGGGPGGRADDFILIEVGDTGCGIAPENLERIWEPFFTTKEHGKGTGLGLSTVRGIVASHRGFCTVVSAPGRGTTFQLFLPAAESTPATSPAIASAAAPRRGRGERILVVDDDPQVRDFLSAVLTTYGYRVTLAIDGLEALTLLETGTEPPRLAVVDRMLPNFGGDALLALLRRRWPELRLLVMSGMEPSTNETVPGDSFLAKPFKPEALLAEVDRLLQAGPPPAPENGPESRSG